MKINVSKRDVVGKKVKNLRQEGKLPASVYGPKTKPVNVSVNLKDFKHLFKEVGYSNLFEMTIDDKDEAKVLVKEVQYDPVLGDYIHVSLYQVDMKSAIVAEIPVNFIGDSPAVKNNVGLIVHPTSTVTVHCLPADLPSEIIVDVSNLNEIGDAVQLEDIKLPEGVEWDSNMPDDLMLAYISAPQKAIVEEEAEEAEGEEGEEGEEGAEGEGEGAEGEGTEGREGKEGEPKPKAETKE